MLSVAVPRKEEPGGWYISCSRPKPTERFQGKGVLSASFSNIQDRSNPGIATVPLSSGLSTTAPHCWPRCLGLMSNNTWRVEWFPSLAQSLTNSFKKQSSWNTHNIPPFLSLSLFFSSFSFLIDATKKPGTYEISPHGKDHSKEGNT